MPLPVWQFLADDSQEPGIFFFTNPFPALWHSPVPEVANRKAAAAQSNAAVTVYCPMFYKLTEEEVDYISGKVKEFYGV